MSKVKETQIPLGVFLLIPILIIGTCNYIVNTRDDAAMRKELLENPVIGTYCVFYNLRRSKDKNREQVLKLKEVRNDTFYFYLPLKEFPYGFEVNESEEIVREEDEEGEMFSQKLMRMTKKQLQTFMENDNLMKRLRKDPDTQMFYLFR